jgi:hypothetical protein
MNKRGRLYSNVQGFNPDYLLYKYTGNPLFKEKLKICHHMMTKNVDTNDKSSYYSHGHEVRANT